MSTNREQALREFAYKYAEAKIIQDDIGVISILPDEDNINALLSDLTALIAEHYYPKEFVKWMINNTCEATNYSPMLYMKYQTKQEREQNNMQIYNLNKEWHIDDLFDYWKENER